MDLYEKAHSSKNSTVMKESKSDEIVKKQLKQMLEGYKQSDNKLIKKSENLASTSHRHIDDSSSVSGFSDLNLTDNERDISHNQDSDIEEPNTALNISKNDDNNPNKTILSTLRGSVPICYKEIMKSFPEEVPSHLDSITLDKNNISIVSSSTEATDNDSETLEAFDPNGELAMKILQRLDLENNTGKTNIEKKVAKNKKIPKKDISKPVGESAQELGENSKSEFTIDNQTKEKEYSSRDLLNISPPFLSISATATDTPEHSFGDLFGEYKHSTVTNLPSNIRTLNSTIETVEDSSAEIRENNVVVDIDASYDDNSEDYETIQDEEIATESDDEEIATESDDEDIDVNVEYESDDFLDNHVVAPYESDENSDTYEFNETVPHGSTGDLKKTLELATECSGNSVNPVQVYYARNSCILVMRHPAQLYIHGKVNMRALGGTVEIFGYILKNKVCHVYAPNYNYALCLKTVDNNNTYYGLFNKLTSAGLTVIEAEDIVTSIGKSDGVVCLTPLESSLIDFLRDSFTLADLFNKTSKIVDKTLRQASNTLGCSLYLSKPLKFFEEYDSWDKVLKCGLMQQSRGIVCGGKGVGKSTFLRYSINKLLCKGPVLVIDLDPGQTEFTPAGSLSATVVTEPLLGPNFTHLRQPNKMLYLGLINTMENTSRYGSTVTDLLAYCREKKTYENMPWVINTMGLCNAVGLKFMTLIILQTKPTYILQIDSKSARRRFEQHFTLDNVKELYNEYKYNDMFSNAPTPDCLKYSFFSCDPMESLGKKDYSSPPKEERYLNYLAYFGKLITSRQPTLLNVKPYRVNVRNFHIGLNVYVDPASVMKVINGKIVALCQLPTAGAATVFTLQDKALVCYGYGLVRGINYLCGVLFIITPCQDLELVNTLVYADWAPEIRGQERQLPHGTKVPYRTTNSIQDRPYVDPPRRRFNPLQLLKMSRKS